MIFLAEDFFFWEKAGGCYNNNVVEKMGVLSAPTKSLLYILISDDNVPIAICFYFRCSRS